MAESRFERWSRRKREATRPTEAPTPPPAQAELELTPEAQELAVNEALPEQEVLAKYGLPDPDDIKLGTDITGFMRKEIPELLRRRALRALWRSNPVLAVLDGLNDYDEDYTAAGFAKKGATTLYKVGQGFDRKLKPVEDEPAALTEQPEPAKAEPIATQPATPAVEHYEPQQEPVSQPAVEEKSEPAFIEASSGTNTGVQAGRDEEQETRPFRYRPRMSFDS